MAFELFDKSKVKPIYSFNVNFTVNIPISGTEEFLDKVEKYCKKKKTDKTNLSRNIINKKLKDKGFKNSIKLAEKSELYKPFVKSFKELLRKELETENISKFIINGIYKRWGYEGFD